MRNDAMSPAVARLCAVIVKQDKATRKNSHLPILQFLIRT
jgi:hypothetical protein